MFDYPSSPGVVPDDLIARGEDATVAPLLGGEVVGVLYDRDRGQSLRLSVMHRLWRPGRRASRATRLLLPVEGEPLCN